MSQERREQRNEKRNKRVQRKAVFGVLDKMYEALVGIAKKWDRNTVPLDLLKITIDSHKAKHKPTGDKFLDELNQGFNTCLDSLYTLCVATAKTMHSESIPVSEVKRGIDIIKKAYT